MLGVYVCDICALWLARVGSCGRESSTRGCDRSMHPGQWLDGGGHCRAGGYHAFGALGVAVLVAFAAVARIAFGLSRKLCEIARVSLWL